MDQHDRDHQHDHDDSEFEYLELEIAENIATVTIIRPDALNALNGQLMLELATAFDLAEANLDVRALIITGSGRAFVAGADIENLQKLSDTFGGREARSEERRVGTAGRGRCVVSASI